MRASSQTGNKTGVNKTKALRRIALALIGISVLGSDQAIKIFLSRFLKVAETIPIINNVFHITLVFNTGCAFGLFRSRSTPIFLVASALVVLFFIYFLRRLRGENFLPRLAAILIISGSVSNLIDRFRLGCVIDFLDFRVWPVFNLGDTAITIGVSIFILQLFRRNRKPSL